MDKFTAACALRFDEQGLLVEADLQQAIRRVVRTRTHAALPVVRAEVDHDARELHLTSNRTPKKARQRKCHTIVAMATPRRTTK